MMEKLTELLNQEPQLTEHQVTELTKIGYASILPPLDLVKLGWRTAQRHIRTELGMESKT